MRNPKIINIAVSGRTVVIEIDESRLYGQCTSHDLYCPHNQDTYLRVVAIDARMQAFCSEKCAQDFYHEASGSTFNLFPNRSDAIPQDIIELNLDLLD